MCLQATEQKRRLDCSSTKREPVQIYYIIALTQTVSSDNHLIVLLNDPSYQLADV